MIGKVNRKARSRQGGGTAFIACAIAAILFAATPAHSATEDVTYTPDVSFTLLTGIAEGKLVYIGRGGEIDGIVNPTLRVREDAVVQITLINGEGAEHDIVFPDFKAASERIVAPGASSTIVFRVGSAGSYVYFCAVPGHREAGMEGNMVVEEAKAEKSP